MLVLVDTLGCPSTTQIQSVTSTSLVAVGGGRDSYTSEVLLGFMEDLGKCRVNV